MTQKSVEQLREALRQVRIEMQDFPVDAGLAFREYTIEKEIYNLTHPN